MGLQGNTIRGNIITGNPPVQVAADHAATTGYDIKNMATAGGNTFDGNLCLTGLNAPCPGVPAGGNPGLASELESAVCGAGLRAAPCQAPVAVWNDRLGA